MFGGWGSWYIWIHKLLHWTKWREYWKLSLINRRRINEPQNIWPDTALRHWCINPLYCASRHFFSRPFWHGEQTLFITKENSTITRTPPSQSCILLEIPFHLWYPSCVCVPNSVILLLQVLYLKKNYWHLAVTSPPTHFIILRRQISSYSWPTKALDSSQRIDSFYIDRIIWQL